MELLGLRLSYPLGSSHYQASKSIPCTPAALGALVAYCLSNDRLTLFFTIFLKRLPPKMSERYVTFSHKSPTRSSTNNIDLRMMKSRTSSGARSYQVGFSMGCSIVNQDLNCHWSHCCMIV